MKISIGFYVIYPSGQPFNVSREEFARELRDTEHIDDELSVCVAYLKEIDVLKIILSLNVY